MIRIEHQANKTGKQKKVQRKNENRKQKISPAKSDSLRAVMLLNTNGSDFNQEFKFRDTDCVSV